MEVEMSMEDSLVRILMFVIVQALVYLILSNSSNLFSHNKITSFSFKPPRSLSIRRVLASISDLPQGVEPSPSATGFRLATKEVTQEI
ncbi:putative Peroxidase superfamily protein [Hibiscus syriacus]|uniref:Peroxidase superfamily protein n=1 Tax=Hibiscus syriacus TaxID=106335 RepID=A0A6A3BCI1_HIBSY|nr:putative Peroxidase superfamily protein [Hibiscus syriacus]